MERDDPAGRTEDDVATSGNQNYAGTLSGSNNLITMSSMTVPPDTIVGKYGQLATLRYNGGTTQPSTGGNAPTIAEKSNGNTASAR